MGLLKILTSCCKCIQWLTPQATRCLRDFQVFRLSWISTETVSLIFSQAILPTAQSTITKMSDRNRCLCSSLSRQCFKTLLLSVTHAFLHRRCRKKTRTVRGHIALPMLMVMVLLTCFTATCSLTAFFIWKIPAPQNYLCFNALQTGIQPTARW